MRKMRIKRKGKLVRFDFKSLRIPRYVQTWEIKQEEEKMTRAQLRKKFNELKKQNNEYLSEQLERAIKSGALELKDYDNNFALAKIIMTVACENASKQWHPVFDDYIAELKNLRNFL